jgi:hypothetical protein
MNKRDMEKMSGAALVIGLSLGIGAEQALAVEANEQPNKDLILMSKTDGASQNPNIYKFAVDPNKPGAQTESAGVIQKQGSPGSQFTAPGDVAGMKSGAATEPNHYKLSDVLVSSAKDDTPNAEAAKPSGKTNAKIRGNARKPGSN